MKYFICPFLNHVYIIHILYYIYIYSYSRYNIHMLAVVGYTLYIFVFSSPVSIILYTLIYGHVVVFLVNHLKILHFYNLCNVFTIWLKLNRWRWGRPWINSCIYYIYTDAPRRWVWIVSMYFKSEIERPTVFCARFFAAA